MNQVGYYKYIFKLQSMDPSTVNLCFPYNTLDLQCFEVFLYTDDTQVYVCVLFYFLQWILQIILK